MILRALHSFLIFSFLLVSSTTLLAQDPFDDEFQAGLVATYVDQDDRRAQRVDARVAFAWSRQAPDLRLGDGDFTSTWRGTLMSQASGDYTLAAYVMGGSFSIELNGDQIAEGQSSGGGWFTSKPVNLSFDFHPITVRFHKQEAQARLVLFWSGPQFQWEPIPADYFFHDPQETPEETFAQGEQFVRAFRCNACHRSNALGPELDAPSLKHIRGALRPSWIVDRLRSAGTPLDEGRKMPHFGFSADDARDLAAFLIEDSTSLDWSPAPEPVGRRKRDQKDKKAANPVGEGERLFLTLGCRGCHQLEAKASSPFAGGSLTEIANKRPPAFFEQWLAAPETINPQHRMPVFQLSPTERKYLAAYLSTLGDRSEAEQPVELGDSRRGRTLFEEHRCVSCHQVSVEIAEGPSLTPLAELDLTKQGCLDAANLKQARPGYQLGENERAAVVAFVSEFAEAETASRISAEQLIRQQNCLVCHARDGASGLGPRLAEWAKERDELAPLVAGMTPPSLNQIGDKMHAGALQAALERRDAPYRDYLLVRMPRFRLSEKELEQLVNFFIVRDRIPEEASPPSAEDMELDPLLLQSVGSRLVTADGFGCTSCHQIGSVRPSKAPLNTRGPNLSECESRIRREWFDRFVRNPARINRALEMPSVRLAVRGVLNEDLDDQLAAVWEVINEPGFEPPEPDPLRVVRHSGLPAGEARATVVTDVVRTKQETFIKPLLIGLKNRHSVLFDLKSAKLVRWSIGDTARQRTEGKTWYWEAAGAAILQQKANESELSLRRGSEAQYAARTSQFATQIDQLIHEDGGLILRHRLAYTGQSTGHSAMLTVEERFMPLIRSGRSGFRRQLTIRGVPGNATLGLRVAESDVVSEVVNSGRTLALHSDGVTISLGERAGGEFSPDGMLELIPEEGVAVAELEYLSTVPVDRFVVPPIRASLPEPQELSVVPGFEAVRLPLLPDVMPTALAWRPNGELVIASLAGRVWTIRDLDGDGLEEDVRPFSDDLAAPYGLYATDDYVDVVTKFAVIRLFDDDGDRRADRMISVASGWGHTDDYHDWAVGLPRGPDGSYYIALPCQQDQRSEAAAHLRGRVLRLVPREPTDENPDLFRIEELTGGHRFPMGIALRHDGELFVTDNQGNYNPFNELNHIVKGRRFGFINALERVPGFNPPLTSAAIKIPHPWTRSVNGICFLQAADGSSRDEQFGPFAGHLVGCEYDTRRLVRMTLHEVDGEYQGAIYPLSLVEPPKGPPFLGPLACAISPQGDLYVGGIQDSGWGGGNNIGEIVRLRPRVGDLPCGIAEVRAVVGGIQIRFTKPIDAKKAADPASYSVSSYTRVSTPAYGGDDQQRRNQPVRNVRVAADQLSVVLEVESYLPGHVYEIHVKSLASGEAAFFPAEAHYTMRAVPTDGKITVR